MFADELDAPAIWPEEDSIPEHDCPGCGGVVTERVCPGCGYRLSRRELKEAQA